MRSPGPGPGRRRHGHGHYRPQRGREDHRPQDSRPPAPHGPVRHPGAGGRDVGISPQRHSAGGYRRRAVHREQPVHLLGHAANISGILRRSGRGSVVLLDELGTGTEPVQGAALACSVLQELQEAGALVIATTHLTDIVGFVHRRDGMVNASMEFDRETLTPSTASRKGSRASPTPWRSRGATACPMPSSNGPRG